MTAKKHNNMTLDELERAIKETEERNRELVRAREAKRREEHAKLCKMIGEFVMDLSDLDAPAVNNFRTAMAAKNYEAAARMLAEGLKTSVLRAGERDRNKGKHTGKKEGQKGTTKEVIACAL